MSKLFLALACVAMAAGQTKPADMPRIQIANNTDFNLICTLGNRSLQMSEEVSMMSGAFTKQQSDQAIAKITLILESMQQENRKLRERVEQLEARLPLPIK